jgi:hypothetical protein
MANNETIIKDIENKLCIVHEFGESKTRKGWTKAFLNALGELVIEKNYGFKFYPNKKDSEWLVDHCWCIENDSDWKVNFKGLKFACESELTPHESHDHIVYDFQKLAVVKAEIKLMIFQFNGEEEFKNIKEARMNSISNELKKDGTYILFGSSNEKCKFEHL